LLENCVLYISRMYEFSHSQGQILTPRSAPACLLPPGADMVHESSKPAMSRHSHCHRPRRPNRRASATGGCTWQSGRGPPRAGARWLLGRARKRLVTGHWTIMKSTNYLPDLAHLAEVCSTYCHPQRNKLVALFPRADALRTVRARRAVPLTSRCDLDGRDFAKYGPTS
jgi:hypothetical protein